ncbi:MAG: hypothetical protein IKH56_06100 [Oscillospiraceae bacterium]|nr:hypothetical protein [Oscillospiraceae bacterium]
MRVLYITASCLTRNTSANISHNAFVKGLLENRCSVDILMAKDSWGAKDSALPIWKGAAYHAYDSLSFPDRLRLALRGTAPANTGSQNNASPSAASSKKPPFSIRSAGKRLFYLVFPADPLYPLEKTWLKEAIRFSSNEVYDLVFSNSSPSASHKLARELIRKGRIQCKRWVQVWEDPWYGDLYSSRSSLVRQEEHELLQAASEIYYVSPLTLDYQKQLFSDCADKMKYVPLPCLPELSGASRESVSASFSCGYFGDYYSKTRNLLPFYEAVRNAGIRTCICGDSDLGLTSTDNVSVSGRVTLDVLANYQNDTEILVHLCNLKGGQIPGKVYHYSATTKPILFILDGTPEEQLRIRSFFEPFDRYVFSANDRSSILEALQRIHEEKRTYRSVEAFMPQNVVHTILNQK